MKSKLRLSDLISFCIISVLGLIMLFFITVRVSAVDIENSDRIIVALGDSYSSGEGIETFFDQDLPLSQKVESQDWLCHRSQNAWSGMLTLKDKNGNTIRMKDSRGTADKEGHWYFAAMSEAVTANILDVSDLPETISKKYKEDKFYRFKDYKKITDDAINIPVVPVLAKKYSGSVPITPQLKIFDALGGKKVDYVVMTLGGNDAKFQDVVTKVVTGFGFIDYKKNNDDTLKNMVDTILKEKMPNILGELKKCYNAIDEKTNHQAQIIVAGYPHLFCDTHKGFVIEASEIKYVNDAITIFNNKIKETVEECKKEKMNIHFVSVEEKFKGKEAYSGTGIFSDKGAFINSIYPSKSQDLKDFELPPVSAYSMHPNIYGAAKYAECVQDKIDELEDNTVFSGTVTNEDGKLLSGVKVTVTDNYGRNRGETLTKNGKYSIKTWQQKECKYTITLEKTGYDPIYISNKESALDIKADAKLHKNSSYKDGQDEDEMYQAYLSVIKNHLLMYGKGTVQDDNFSPTTYCLGGLGIVRLIDLDKDGQEELITIGYRGESIYPSYELNICRYDGENVVAVYSDSLCIDINPTDFIGKMNCLGFNYYDTGSCYRVLTKTKQVSFYDLEWSELKNGKMVTVETVSQLYNTSTQQYDYTINGKAVGEREFYKYTDEMENKIIDIQCSGSSSEYLKSVLDETNTVLKKLGYSEKDNIIDLAEYENQKSIYKYYLENDNWRSYNEMNGKIHSESGPLLEELSVKNTLFFDYDGDGTLEMWMDASSGVSEYYYLRPRRLTILRRKNNSAISGGTICQVR